MYSLFHPLLPLRAMRLFFALAVVLCLTDRSLDAADRGRVKILNGTVVTDDNKRLRGAPMLIQKRSSFDLAWATDPDSWQLLKDNGINTVRIVFMDAYNRFRTDGKGCSWSPCYTNNEVLPIFDDLVNLASSKGMYIIINYHDVGHYDLPNMQDFWSKVAPRYKDRTHVIYETANEPVAWTPDKYTNAVLTDLGNLHKNTVRALAPNTHVMHLCFSQPSTNMKTVVDAYTPLANIVWSQGKDSVAFHTYAVTSSGNISTLKNSYPVVCTEWGYPGAPVVKTLDNKTYHGQVLEGLGISWIDWGADNSYGFNRARLQRHVNEFQADARSKGYFWPNDYPQTTLHSNDFNSATTGMAPSGWTIQGTTIVANVPSSTNKSVHLQDTSALSSSSMQRSFTSQTRTFDVQFSFMQPALADYFRARVLQSSLQATAIITRNGHIAYRDTVNNVDVLVTPYSPNTWYNVKLTVKPGSDRFDLYVNNQLLVVNEPFVNNAVTSLDTFGFNTDGTSIGATYVDNTAIRYR